MSRLIKIIAVSLATVFIFSIIGCGNNGRNEVVDINEMGPNNQHMIFWRIQEDDFDSVEAFLDAGVDVNIRGFMGMTPAIWAAGAGGWRMVELLASRGADLDIAARNGRTIADYVQLSEALKNVKLDSPDGRAYLRVIQILKDRGLY